MGKTRIIFPGFEVVAEEGVVYVNETLTERSKEALVLTVRNTQLPKFLVFSEKNWEHMTKAEQEDLIGECCRFFPEVGKAKLAEVKEELGKGGEIKNLAEWKASPHFILSPVWVVKDENSLLNGAGIVFKRTEKIKRAIRYKLVDLVLSMR